MQITADFDVDAAFAEIAGSPSDRGIVELIVRRPDIGEREILEAGELSLESGLVGDSWDRRPSKRTPDGSPHPEMQLNIINARVSRIVAGDDAERRALAGDQLHVDLDLTPENLPAGTRLAIGSAVIEITAQPHTGCKKFSGRFGADALRFVNTGRGGEMRLRGINAKVVVPGTITAGTPITKL